MIRIQDEWRYFDEVLKMPYPWYTSPCLHWLSGLDFKGKNVFEFGSGNSHLWYTLRGAAAYGVDSDTKYTIAGHVSFALSMDNYVNAIYSCVTQNKINKYDIVIIDGDYRDECTEHALRHLSPGGYLIIDNYKQQSVQADWPLTEKLIEDMNAKYFKEPGHPDWQTIVVTK